MIVLDCRDGAPDRSGAAAIFEGFFDLETGEPRRPGLGIPRLRVIAPPTPAIAAGSAPSDVVEPWPSPAVEASAAADVAPTAEVSPTTEVSPPRALVAAPTRAPAPAAPERLWGFECWWRPDPGGAGLTLSDHEELEQSKRLLRGLLRDTRRAGRSLQPR